MAASSSHTLMGRIADKHATFAHELDIDLPQKTQSLAQIQAIIAGSAEINAEFAATHLADRLNGLYTALSDLETTPKRRRRRPGAGFKVVPIHARRAMAEDSLREERAWQSRVIGHTIRTLPPADRNDVVARLEVCERQLKSEIATISSGSQWLDYMINVSHIAAARLQFGNSTDESAAPTIDAVATSSAVATDAVAAIPDGQPIYKYVGDDGKARRPRIDMRPRIGTGTAAVGKPTYGTLAFVKERSATNDGQLYNRYMATAEGDVHYKAPRKIERPEHCDACNVSRICIPASGAYACPNCGSSVDYIANDMSAVPFNHKIDIKTQQNYECVNYAADWFRKIAGKHTQAIPEDVVNVLKVQYQRMNLKTVNERTVKFILRRYNMQKYYDDVPQLVERLGGAAAATPSEMQVQVILKDFLVFLKSFQRCPNNVKKRKNAPSYGYVLLQLCRRRKWNRIAKHFPLLDGTQKRRSHDNVWRWICSDTGWKFRPTLGLDTRFIDSDGSSDDGDDGDGDDDGGDNGDYF